MTKGLSLGSLHNNHQHPTWKAVVECYDGARATAKASQRHGPTHGALPWLSLPSCSGLQY